MFNENGDVFNNRNVGYIYDNGDVDGSQDCIIYAIYGSGLSYPFVLAATAHCYLPVLYR